MRNSKAMRYAAPVMLLYGALTLPFDLHGYATMISEAWPVIKAFLPLIGTMLAVGAVIWILWNLGVDLPQIYRRFRTRNESRKFHERQKIVNKMRFVVENARMLDNFANPELASRVRLEMDCLINLGIVPKNYKSWQWLHFHLLSLIPIVEVYGIKEARRSAVETESAPKDEGSAERC